MKTHLPMAVKKECGTCTKCCEGWLGANIKGHEMYPGKPCFVAYSGTAPQEDKDLVQKKDEIRKLPYYKIKGYSRVVILTTPAAESSLTTSGNVVYVIEPDSVLVSNPLANPFAPYGPAAIALEFEVLVVLLIVPFIILPVVKVTFTPASFASEHPSPSLSKSNLFGIPSLSVSSSVQGDTTPVLVVTVAAINFTF